MWLTGDSTMVSWLTTPPKMQFTVSLTIGKSVGLTWLQVRNAFQVQL